MPVGAALLVTSTYGQWSRRRTSSSGIDETVGRCARRSRRSDVRRLRAATHDLVPRARADRPPPSRRARRSRPTSRWRSACPRTTARRRSPRPPPTATASASVEMCGRVVWPQRETSRAASGGSSPAALGPGVPRVARAVRPRRRRRRRRAMAVLRRAVAECHAPAQPGVDGPRPRHRLRHGDDGPDVRRRAGQLGLPGHPGRFGPTAGRRRTVKARSHRWTSRPTRSRGPPSRSFRRCARSRKRGARAMSIPSTLASCGLSRRCPRRDGCTVAAPVRLLGAHVVWQVLWRRQPADAPRRHAESHDGPAGGPARPSGRCSRPSA